jgi:OOP family OmpA-OmpF porin
MRPFLLYLALALAAATPAAPAQVAAPAGPVVASGTVPDESSKAAVLARLRELYGEANVVDQIGVGQVALPVNWNGYVHKLIGPNLKQISRGALIIDGNVVSVRGDVANEAQRQKIASDIATSLNSTYTVNNGLRVASAGQDVLDRALANRIIEFESGKASITASGRAILDEMSVAMQTLRERKIAVIGHTDNQGPEAHNQSLSQARAEAVRLYLAAKGISADAISASGKGAGQPIANNESAEGRARNRRIEFWIVQ